MITDLGYAADVLILGTYWWLSRSGRPLPFHWANAVCCVPLLVAEVHDGLWQVVAITGTFGVLGWLGVIREHRNRKKGE